MPIVPTYSVPQVQPMALPAAHEQVPRHLLDSATLGPMQIVREGAAMQDVGKELSNAISMDQIQQNEAAAKDFDSQQMGANQAVVDDFLNKKGNDAIQGYQAAVDKVMQTPADLSQNLDNPAQQSLVKHTANMRINTALTQLNQHKRDQTQVYERAASETRIKVAADGAASSFRPGELAKANFNHDNPGANSAYQEYMQTIRSEAEDRALRDIGAGDNAADLRAEYVKEQMGKAYMGTISHLIDKNNSSSGGIAAASAYFKSVKDDLSTEQRDKVKGVLEAGNTRNGALSLAINLKDKFGTDLAAQEKYLDDQFKAGKISSQVHGLTLSHLRSDFSQTREVMTENDRKFMGDVWNMATQGKRMTDLSAEQLQYVQSRNLGSHVERMFNGEDRNIDDSRVFNDLMRMSAEDPSNFVKADLVAFRGNLTPAHWNHLVGMQTSINRSDVKAMDQNKIAHTAINDAKSQLVAAGFKVNAQPGTNASKKMADFEATMRDSLAAAQPQWDELKLTPIQQREEARKIVNGLLKQETLSGSGFLGMFQTQKAVGLMTPEEQLSSWDVPDADRRQIRESLRRNGLPDNEDNIQRAFKLRHGVSGEMENRKARANQKATDAAAYDTMREGRNWLVNFFDPREDPVSPTDKIRY